jgi:hypothetical protein
MSEKDTMVKRGQQAVTVILGGLAAGAVLGASVAAAPDGPPVHDQFNQAFVPGARTLSADLEQAIVVNPR